MSHLKNLIHAPIWEPESDRARWLKGSAGTLGFDVFTEPAEELESCIVRGEQTRIPELLGQIDELICRVKKGIQPADVQTDGHAAGVVVG